MNKKIEQTFKQRDVFFALLNQWRMLLIWTIIGAVVLSGFAIAKFFLKQEVIVRDIELTSKQIETIESNVNKENIEAIVLVEQLDRLNETKEYLSKRLSNSLYLKINSDTQPLTTFRVNVDLINNQNKEKEELEKTKRLILLEYVNFLKQDSYGNWIKFNTNNRINKDEINDLIEFTIIENDYIEVKLTAPDEKLLQDFSEATIKYIEKEFHNRTSFIDPVLLTIDNEETEFVSNPKILLDQQNVNEQLKNIIAEIETKEEELEEIYDQAIQQVKTVDSDGNILEIDSKVKVSKFDIVKRAMLGGMIAFLFASFVVAFRFLSSDKLSDVNSISKQTGIPVISEILIKSDQEKDKQKIGYSLDRLIDRKYHEIRSTTLDQQAEVFAKTISFIEGLYVKKSSTTSENIEMSIVGDFNNTTVKNTNDQIQNKLTKGIKKSLVEITTPIDNTISIKELLRTDFAILLLSPGHSCFSEIIRVLEVCNSLSVEILGIISLEII